MTTPEQRERWRKQGKCPACGGDYWAGRGYVGHMPHCPRKNVEAPGFGREPNDETAQSAGTKAGEQPRTRPNAAHGADSVAGSTPVHPPAASTFAHLDDRPVQKTIVWPEPGPYDRTGWYPRERVQRRKRELY